MKLNWRLINMACDVFFLKRGLREPKVYNMVRGAALANKRRHAKARTSK